MKKKQLEKKILPGLAAMVEHNSLINPEVYSKFMAEQGLRDIDGWGVLVGLTEIGEAHSYITDENEVVPVPRRLIYRGIDIDDIVKVF